MVTGSHVLVVQGYSVTKGLGVGESVYSDGFNVAGHRWLIEYCLDGFDEESADYISVFLVRTKHPDPAARADVRAMFCFRLLDHAGRPVPRYTFTSRIQTFSSTAASWGYRTFMARKELEASPYLRDDSFQIRCDLTVFEKGDAEALAPPLPLDLQRHLGSLLASKVGGDVVFEVDGELFTAHRCVLAARSSVFMAQLFGAMKEVNAATGHVLVEDMEARVFRCMLSFIYTDSMPEIDDARDRMVMAQHLLVAADRYNLEKLKVICEDMLRSSDDISLVATTLVLAEQHDCRGLKDACFEFLKSPGNLKAAMATDGFQHLKSSCPSLLVELLAEVAP